MARVMSELKQNGRHDGGGGFAETNGAKENGNTSAENGLLEGGSLRVPRRVVEEGVKVVKGALEGCVEIVGEE